MELVEIVSVVNIVLILFFIIYSFWNFEFLIMQIRTKAGSRSWDMNDVDFSNIGYEHAQ